MGVALTFSIVEKKEWLEDFIEFDDKKPKINVDIKGEFNKQGNSRYYLDNLRDHGHIPEEGLKRNISRLGVEWCHKPSELREKAVSLPDFRKPKTTTRETSKTTW